ncbi:hypothetical protein ACFL1Q_00365 [Patescibacteria group bacterium]
MEDTVKDEGSKKVDNILVNDPWELMDRFYKSSEYKKGFEDFFEGKKLTPDVTEKEKEKEFLSSEVAKIALLDFSIINEVSFKYRPEKFPPNAREAIGIYICHLKEQKKVLEKDNVEVLDSLRWHYHNDAADALVECGIAPSRKIGRTITRIVAIEKGLDTYENAKKPDIKAIESKLGATAI